MTLRLALRNSLVMAATVAALGTVARAGQQSPAIAADTFVNSARPDNNNGGSGFFFVGKTGASQLNGLLRGLLQFNMPSSPNIGNRATVTRVRVTLRTVGIGSAETTALGAGTVSLMPLTTSWVEGTNGTSGAGVWVIGQACTSFGATWNQRFCSFGGGHGNGGADISLANPTTPNVDMTFDSNAGGSMVARVQSWIDGTTSNFGWLVYSADSEAAAIRQKFRTKESGIPPTITIDYVCKAGYDTIGNTCARCTTADRNQCKVGQGTNACNDPGAPNPGYTCTCGAGFTGTGTTACTDPDECAIGSNPCNDNGDSGATCTSRNAPSSGYDCSCSTGFLSNGTSCVGACGSGPDPCGNGGTCAVTTPGQWTCSCPAGYTPSGGTHPACVNFNACDAAAIGRCTTFGGNACVDDAPPATTYHCTCGNAAYVNGTSGGLPACVNKNECATNHCRDGGDTSAICADVAAPGTGYDCTCSSSFWEIDVLSGFDSCVDIDECAAAVNPCGQGTCTNLTGGNGYTCACDSGYVVEGGNTATPTCVHPNSCDAQSDIACVATAGNSCVDTPPPQIGYTCDCSNPAYTQSLDKRSCVDANACIINHCIDEGDARADCVDRNPPRAGYDCDCSPGWVTDGTTCVDINECSAGGNPCGKGTCTNTKGGYQCKCPSGYAATTSGAPTCVPSGSGYVSYTVEAGSCSAAGDSGAATFVTMGLVLGALWLARARRRRAA